MTITHQDELDGLKKIGRIVANAVHSIAAAMEPRMTTRELDSTGHELLEREGAVPAPRATYDFPGKTCTSVNEKIAHALPVRGGLQRGIWSTSTCLRLSTATLPIPEQAFASGRFSRRLTSSAATGSAPCRSASCRWGITSRWPGSATPSVPLPQSKAMR